MILTCWSVKGGSGTSVVAAALAVGWAASRPVLAVDLAGDLPAVLGAPTPSGPGVTDWLGAGPDVGAGALAALAVDVHPGLRLLHRGAGPAGGGPSDTVGGGATGVARRWQDLVAALAAEPGDVVVDAGCGAPPRELIASPGASLLVTRLCYLALRRAVRLPCPPSGVVLVAEAGRALGRRDVEQTVGVRVAAQARVDPAIARAVDAGLLATRLPSSLARLARDVDRWASAFGKPLPTEPAVGVA